MIVASRPDHSLREAVRVPWRHKGKALLFFFGVVGAGVAATLLMPKTYRSEGKLLLRLGRENMSLDPTATMGNAPVVTFQQTRENETNSVIEIIRSRGTLEKTVDAIGPAAILGLGEINADSIDRTSASAADLSAADRDDAIRKLSRSLDVEAVRKSNVVQITCDSSSPQTAQAIVNKLIAVYLDEHIRLNRTPGGQEFLAEQTSSMRERLKEKEDALRKLTDETGLTEPDGRKNIVVTRIGRLEDELLQTSSELTATEAEVKRLQEQLKSLPATEVTEETVGFANEAADLMRNQLYSLQMKEQDLATKFTDDHPQLQQVRRQIAEAQAVLDKQDPARTQTKKGVSKPHEEVKLQLLKQEPVLAALRAKHTQIKSQLESERGALEKLNADELAVARLQREVQIEESNYRKYSDSLEQARIDGAMAQQGKSNISIVQAATLDLQPVRPKVLFNIALAVIVGVLGGIGLTYVAESLREPGPAMREPDHHLELPTVAASRRAEVSGIR